MLYAVKEYGEATRYGESVARLVVAESPGTTLMAWDDDQQEWVEVYDD